MDIIKYTSEYEELRNNFTCGNIVIDNFLKNQGTKITATKILKMICVHLSKKAIRNVINCINVLMILLGHRGISDLTI